MNRRQYNGQLSANYLFDEAAAICVTVNWGSRGYYISKAWISTNVMLPDYPYRRSWHDWQVVNYFLEEHQEE